MPLDYYPPTPKLKVTKKKAYNKKDLNEVFNYNNMKFDIQDKILSDLFKFELRHWRLDMLN